MKEREATFMNGKLIVIEGLDGSGKNTQTKLLVDYFKKNTEHSGGVKYLSFPNYSSPSSSLVKMYLNSEFGKNPEDVNAYAAASFFAVDRYADYKKNWENFYKNPLNVVVCDRYTTSNAIYQMCKLDEIYWQDYLTWLYDYEYNKLELPKPTAVIYLEMPVDISQNLMKKRYDGDESKKDLHEANLNFLKTCEKAAKYISLKDKWFNILCVKEGKVKDKGEIHEEIISFLQENILN